MDSREVSAHIVVAMIERGYFDESANNDARINDIVDAFNKINAQFNKPSPGVVGRRVNY